MRWAVVGCGLVLVLPLGACSSQEPSDYGYLTTMAGRVEKAFGHPPGVAEFHARGGSIGDAGYFDMEAELAPDATGDELMELLRVHLPEVTAAARGYDGAPLHLVTTEGDRLDVSWGEHADLDAEEPLVRAWVDLARRTSPPVTGSASPPGQFLVDLGEVCATSVAGSYRGLAERTGGHAEWTVTASVDGTDFRFTTWDGHLRPDRPGAWRAVLRLSRLRPGRRSRCAGLNVPATLGG